MRQMSCSTTFSVDWLELCLTEIASKVIASKAIVEAVPSEYTEAPVDCFGEWGLELPRFDHDMGRGDDLRANPARVYVEVVGEHGGLTRDQYEKHVVAGARRVSSFKLGLSEDPASFLRFKNPEGGY